MRGDLLLHSGEFSNRSTTQRLTSNFASARASLSGVNPSSVMPRFGPRSTGGNLNSIGAGDGGAPAIDAEASRSTEGSLSGGGNGGNAKFAPPLLMEAIGKDVKGNDL